MLICMYDQPVYGGYLPPRAPEVAEQLIPINVPFFLPGFSICYYLLSCGIVFTDTGKRYAELIFQVGNTRYFVEG